MKYRDLTKAHRKRFWLTFCIYIGVGAILLGSFSSILHAERQRAHADWYNYLQDTPEQAALAQERGANATQVTVGTYVENLREINIKGSYFRVEFMVWFDWEGDEALDPAHNFRVYKGLENKHVLLNEVHESNKHYQLVGMDVSVSKKFETKRFPLESHQMRFYIESTHPIEEVVFVPDHDNSGINRNITLSGYDFLRNAIGQTSFLYDSTHGDPTQAQNEMTSEIVTAIEINRSNFGMYYRCFIALLGTLTWALIVLYICTYHHVDPLGMIPAALFGTVTNVMIGANLLPDALEMGLLEFVNLWGVACILGAALAIININSVRKHDQSGFAHYYGKMLFFTVLALTIIGQITLPLVTYIL